MSNLNCTPWHNLSYMLLLGALFCTCNYCTLQEILSACELKCVSIFSSFAIPLHITSETHSKFIQIIQELRNCSQTKPNYIGSYKPLGYLFTVQSIISMNPCINKTWEQAFQSVGLFKKNPSSWVHLSWSYIQISK